MLPYQLIEANLRWVVPRLGCIETVVQSGKTAASGFYEHHAIVAWNIGDAMSTINVLLEPIAYASAVHARFAVEQSCKAQYSPIVGPTHDVGLIKQIGAK